ncbi:putative polysaccharide deacetylase associated with biofilm formation; putative lipoprotein [Crenothrix polyspora]|uniref:Putative polysaccharide deacetylase associated with biofilm formation putative lipoprotein n=1 Tax=Crenothrix polyspora TaxID=360316 RepID=A0A1R4HIN2_9GAMM|nr:poly-beta-1,6-N-acetyl-D-glucosamine N-deacetylase PgaB [Crenothrix polyspora]SJM96092.1 putative polysaccharide deacetylase associated with biofilm formation; putative lipoprotein [Crenothrix polyspora]
MFKTIAFVLSLLSSSVACAYQDTFIALCYHDVRDTWNDDPTTISVDNLISQLSWIKTHNFHPVSIQDIVDARDGVKPLPENAVLLTFDDGYTSFYTRIYPTLKMFNFPAVYGLVTSWMETPKGQMVHYGHQLKPRDEFISWEQAREMSDSGLIEMASHTDDLHHGIISNPQNNSEPAATTRIYDPANQSYESDRAFSARIDADLEKSADILYKHLGKRPRALIWPYGSFSHEAIGIARDNGFSVTMSLQDGINNPYDLIAIKRHLMEDNKPLEDFAYTLTHFNESEPIRVAHVDLDYIYDADPLQVDRNLGKLLDRIEKLRINTVYLQAYADPDGNGNADALYFPNRHLPMRSDLFNRVAWQLKTRAKVNVYAWMPVLAFAIDAPDDWWVQELKDGKVVRSQNNYQRLSPFHPEAREFIAEIYEDLAKNAHFYGILFHDDAILTDFEDASPAAQLYTKGLKPEEQMAVKISALTDFTLYLTEKVRHYRPEIKTARNLYANVALNPASSAWLAQSLPNFLQHYDYVAVMAMPQMESAENPSAWLSTLIDKIALHPQGLKKTVFELQAVDWKTRQQIPDEEVSTQMELLQRRNALNFGYYPDNFLLNQPSLTMLKTMMSLETLPFGN